MRSKTINH